VTDLAKVLKDRYRQAHGTVREARIAASYALRTTVRAAILVVRRCLEFLLALILLFEEWGWRPLADFLGRLKRFPAWERIETGISDLPPYPALLFFGVPVVLLFPLKILALYLVASGKVVLAGALFVAAKVVGTATVARIFVLTHPKLMQIGWFARGYNWLMPWQEAVFDSIRATWAWRYGRLVKARVKGEAKRVWQRLRPRVLAAMSIAAAAAGRVTAGWGEGVRDAWRKMMRHTR